MSLRKGGKLTLCAVETSPAGAAPALPIVGAALGSVVTAARVETVRAPVPRGTDCRCQSQDHGHTHSHIITLVSDMHTACEEPGRVFNKTAQYLLHSDPSPTSHTINSDYYPPPTVGIMSRRGCHVEYVLGVVLFVT